MSLSTIIQEIEKTLPVAQLDLTLGNEVRSVDAKG